MDSKKTKEQGERFKEAARDLDCDEDPAHFEEKLKKVAAHKPVADMPEPSPEKTGNIDPDEGLRPREKQSKRAAPRLVSRRSTRRTGRK